MIGRPLLGLAIATCVGCDDPNEHLWKLRVGDCLNDPIEVERENIVEIQEVSCDDAHHAELYARLEHPGDDYPGMGALSEYAAEECQPSFADFIGVGYRESALELYKVWPSATSWANGDREILCGVFDPSGPLTGSARGSQR